MKAINSGKLRAINHEARARILQARHNTGSTFQYGGGARENIWHRLSSSGAARRFYRDNNEEEFTLKKVSARAPAGKNPLHDLFGLK